MKFTRIFVFFLVALVGMGAGCAIPPKHDLTKPKVGATIFPIYDLVRIVGGNDIETELILPPGASPHTYEPAPSVIKSLQGSSLIFQIGHGLDQWTAPIASSIPGVKLVTLDKNIQLRSATDTDEPGSDSFDPHYWMDPTNGYIMLDTIVEELSKLDPVHALDFADRAQKFKIQLEKKDLEWKDILSQLENKDFITFHDAFMYFADHFQLHVVATFEPFPGREPTPQYLINLQKEIKKYTVKTLYMEPQLAGDLLQTFAHDNGLTVAILDPEGSKNSTTYLDMIDYNVRTFAANQR